MPLFSTIIPVYNRPDLVVETIESVLNQTFKDQEIIVIDDGSTDRTPEVLARYKDRVRLLRQNNQGLGAARNNAMAAAAGEYVIFLDSDDLWLPWALERMAEAIAKHKHPSLVLGAIQSFTNADTVQEIQPAPLRDRYYADYLASWREPAWLTPSSLAVKREILQKAGGFFIHRFTHEENDAWLRVSDAPGFVRIDRPVCCARREHAGNISAYSMKNVEGGMYLIDSEGQGKYPGGKARRKARWSLITMHIRPVSIGCLNHKESKWAWRLFRRTFGWNLALLRFRYLAAFPILAIRERLKGSRMQ